MTTKSKPKQGITATALGKHLDLTRQRISQLSDEGIFQPLAAGGYDQDACRLAYIRWLRSDDRRSSKSAAASRRDDAKARLLDLQVAEREYRLVDTERALAIVEDIVGIYRTGFSGLPARVTRDVGLRRQIETAIDAIQNDVATTLGQRAVDLRAGREILDAVPEDDA